MQGQLIPRRLGVVLMTTFPNLCFSYNISFAKYISYLFLLFSSGWRTYHATYSLDASREHHVQEILHGKRRLELRSHLVGDLYVREAALVSAGEQRGTRHKIHITYRLSRAVHQIIALGYPVINADIF